MVKSTHRCRRSSAEGNNNLFERHVGAVTGCEDARNRRCTSVIDHDFASPRQGNGVLEPFGVGDETDLHEYAIEIDAMLGRGSAVLVNDCVDSLPVTEHFFGQRIGDDGDVGERLNAALI